ncbi:tryptophan synthase subunit alpha [Oleiagrimonas sp.]|jgi:tryptophan synthase alpha chain|uniref:tryptophan synthase subunit alpha n=1 Tax=Oleiagrimonas sp. TaxID=2010330 RepID=UPI00263374A7|nr:tryptophan synthase subunit alpha [Oleiagrimonas sp.]MDA3915187.1 tryptophan synthase subunit alpha [Oleiagrimonas sp.]
MTRLQTRFAALKSAGRCGLIPFVTAGDPGPELTVPVMHALVAAGADVIELGVPFSDPMADGPVIQHASERALAHGVGIKDVLTWVSRFRERDSDTPVVLMGYLNPIEIHGIEEFSRDAMAAGVDGVLLVDCPIEEDEATVPIRAHGLHRILLAAPTTSEQRLLQACEAADGFLYYVSFAGITGAARLSVDAIADRVASIRARSSAPVAVGFGIRDAESAQAIAAFADAVVIGSALVDTLAGAGTEGEAASRVQAFLAPIRAALDDKT